MYYAEHYTRCFGRYAARKICTARPDGKLKYSWAPCVPLTLMHMCVRYNIFLPDRSIRRRRELNLRDYIMPRISFESFPMRTALSSS